MANLYLYNNELWKVKYDFVCDAVDHQVTLLPGSYLLICNGASGGKGTFTNSERQYGGSAYGILDLNETTTLHAIVGGAGRDARSDLQIETDITRDMCDVISSREIFIGNESKWVNQSYSTTTGNGLKNSDSYVVMLNALTENFIPFESMLVAVDAYHVNGTRLKAYIDMITGGNSSSNRRGLSFGVIDDVSTIYLHNGTTHILPSVEYYPEGTDPTNPSNRVAITRSDIRSIVLTWYRLKPEYEYMMDSYNGGGFGGIKPTNLNPTCPGGGGASDIRLLPLGSTETVTTRYAVPVEYDCIEFISFDHSDKTWIDLGYIHKSTTKIEADVFTTRVYSNSDGVGASLIPPMTDYSSPSGTVSCSAYYGSRYPWYAFDGVNQYSDHEKYWSDPTTTLDGNPGTVYLMYEFEESVKIRSFGIWFQSVSYGYNCSIQVRSNGTWTDVQSFTTSASNNMQRLVFNLDDFVECDAVRLNGLSCTSSSIHVLAPGQFTGLQIRQFTVDVHPMRKTSSYYATNEFAFGARNGSSSYNNYEFATRANGWHAAYGRTGDERNGPDNVYPYNTTARVKTYDLTAGIYDETGETLITSITASSGTNNDGVSNMIVGSINNSSSNKTNSVHQSAFWNGSLYGFKIYEDDEIKHCFFPVKHHTDEFVVELTSDDFEQGGIDSNGNKSTSSNRIRYKLILPVDDYKGDILIDAFDNNDNRLLIELDMYYLPEVTSSNYIGYNGWHDGSTTINFNKDYTAYFTIAISRSDSGNISPSDLESFKMTITNREFGLYDVITQTFHANRSIAGKLVDGPIIDQQYYDKIRTIDTSALSRLIVAGGGGGSTNAAPDNGASHVDFSGFGGGIYGGFVDTANSSDPYYKQYASQTDGYKFGIGATVKPGSYTGGGGGGWYGGYASDDTSGSRYPNGGGGSGYVYTASSYKPEPDYAPDSGYYLRNTFMDIGTSQEGSIQICEAVNKPNVGDLIIVPKTNGKQSYTMNGGEYILKCYGGDGATRNTVNTIGRGGYAQGTLTIDEPTELTFKVGGSGRYCYGPQSYVETCNPEIGYNGGGTPVNYTTIADSAEAGGGGTDVRMSSEEYAGDMSRILVAGGAGGCGCGSISNKYSYGGPGGGESGGWDNKSGSLWGDIPGPGTQTESPQTSTTGHETINGGFGYGGNGASANDGYGGAGGGGWYGGSGCYPDSSNDDDRGGCGGSGYAYTETSYKPTGYMVTDPKYYLSNVELTTGGNTLPYGSTRIEIIANNVLSTIKILCKDSQGYKYYDTTNSTWTLLLDQEITAQTFVDYGSYTMTSDTGLLDSYEIYWYDAEDVVTSCRLYVVPTEQEIRYHLDELVDPMDFDVDADYDSTVATINARIEHNTSDPPKSDIVFEVNKLTSDIVKIYNVRMIYKHGDAISYRYIAPQTPVDPDPQRKLLPIGKPNAIDIHYKTNYLSPVGGSTPITSIETTASTMHDRALFIALTLNNTHIRIVSVNINDGFTRLIAEYPKSTFGSKNVSGILVNDDYIYITAVDSRDTNSNIYEISRADTTNITSYAITSLGCYGKIVWLSNEEIVNASTSGLTIFNTRNKSITAKSHSCGAHSLDIATSRNHVFVISTGSSYAQTYYYDIATDTWYDSITLGGGWRYAHVAYGDGKFYVLSGDGYLRIFDDSDMTITFSRVLITGTDYHSIYYTDNQIFVLPSDGTLGYVYDITKDEYQQYGLPWTIPSLNNADKAQNIACAYKHTCFIPRFSIGVLTYNPEVKYQFGEKYYENVYDTNQEHVRDITHDPNYVSFTVSNMRIHDGYINKAISGSTIKHVSVSKTEYNKLNGVELLEEGE